MPSNSECHVVGSKPCMQPGFVDLLNLVSWGSATNWFGLGCAAPLLPIWPPFLPLDFACAPLLASPLRFGCTLRLLPTVPRASLLDPTLGRRPCCPSLLRLLLGTWSLRCQLLLRGELHLGHKDPRDPIPLPTTTWPGAFLIFRRLALTFAIAFQVLHPPSVQEPYVLGTLAVGQGQSSKAVSGTVYVGCTPRQSRRLWGPRWCKFLLLPLAERLSQERETFDGFLGDFFLKAAKNAFRRLKPSETPPTTLNGFGGRALFSRYVERNGGFSGQRDFGLMMWLVCQMGDMMLNGDQKGAQEMLALALVTIEQVAQDGGKWEVGWILALLQEDPPLGMFTSRPPSANPRLRAFSPLCPPEWALSFVKEVDMINTRRQEAIPTKKNQEKSEDSEPKKKQRYPKRPKQGDSTTS